MPVQWRDESSLEHGFALNVFYQHDRLKLSHVAKDFLMQVLGPGHRAGGLDAFSSEDINFLAPASTLLIEHALAYRLPTLIGQQRIGHERLDKYCDMKRHVASHCQRCRPLESGRLALPVMTDQQNSSTLVHPPPPSRSYLNQIKLHPAARPERVN